MLRIGLIELFSVGGSIAAILAYFNNRKNKKNTRLEATFVGGPLDGRKLGVSSYTPLYLHKDISLPGDALYKHNGDGLYVFDEYVQ